MPAVEQIVDDIVESLDDSSSSSVIKSAILLIVEITWTSGSDFVQAAVAPLREAIHTGVLPSITEIRAVWTAAQVCARRGRSFTVPRAALFPLLTSRVSPAATQKTQHAQSPLKKISVSLLTSLTRRLYVWLQPCTTR